MKNIIRFFLCFFFLLSCTSESKKYNEIVKTWYNKKIIFPKNTIYTKFGIDTVRVSEKVADYTLMMYIDSSGCTSCKIQFFKLKEFIGRIKDIKKVKVNLKFYFFPKDFSELKYLLNTNRFNIPVCIDLKDELNKLNNFPKDSRFHTFLLDKNNKVLVIGDFMNNVNVSKLYFKTIKHNLESE